MIGVNLDNVRTCEQNPSIRNLELVISFRQCPVFRRHFIRPKDPLRVKVRRSRLQQRFEGAAVKRRKRRRRSIEERLRYLLQVRYARVVDRGVPVRLQPWINFTWTNLYRLGLRIKGEFNRARHQRIGDVAILARPNGQPDAPRHFELSLDDAAFQLLLQGEQLTIEANRPTAALFHFGPRPPEILHVGLELGAHQCFLRVSS